MNRRRIAIGVSSVSGLAVVAAGTLSMFGSSGSARAVDLHAAPVAAVTGSAWTTRQAGTAQADTVVTVTSPARPAHGSNPATPARTLTMHGSGLFDFGKQVGAVDLTVPTGTLNEVLTPTTLYLRSASPATNATAAAVKGWSRVATAKVSDGNLISFGATDPLLVFAMLGGTQPGVKYVGQDTVRGVPVAHYQGTLDLARAAAALTGPASATSAGAIPGTAASTAVPAAEAAADKQALTNAAHAFITPQVPFDAYLDAQGRLRRFVASFSYMESGGTKSVAQVTSATELFGFGTKVTVVTPTVVPSAVGTSGTSGTSGAAGATGSAPSTSQSAGARRATSPSAHASR